MNAIKKELNNLVDSFNSKMVAEGSIIRIFSLNRDSNIESFEISINEDKYIDSKIINEKDELRDLIKAHFESEFHTIYKWNNGSIFSIDPLKKIQNEIEELIREEYPSTMTHLRFFKYEPKRKSLYATIIMQDMNVFSVRLFSYEKLAMTEVKKFNDYREAVEFYLSDELLENQIIS